MNNLLKKEVVILVVVLLIIPFVLSIDSDRDGIDDVVDEFPNDFDNDGMEDLWEVRNGLRYDVQDAVKDPDNDGLTNLEEFWLKSDPHSKDTDGDEISDYEEREAGLDPLSADKTVWPLVVIPVLILLFILLLFLFEKYHLDLWLHEKFGVHAIEKQDYKPVKKKVVNQKVEPPKIKFHNLTEIYKGREEKKKQKQELVKKLSSFASKPDYIERVKKNKVNEVPKVVEGLISTLETVHHEKEKKKVLNKKGSNGLAKLRGSFKVKSKDVVKKEVKPVKKDSFDKLKGLSKGNKKDTFDKLKRLR